MKKEKMGPAFATLQHLLKKTHAQSRQTNQHRKPATIPKEKHTYSTIHVRRVMQE